MAAIAIPVFTSQLEKSREATDLANIRDLYAEISVAMMVDGLDQDGATATVMNNKTATAAVSGTTITITVPSVAIAQTVNNWQTDSHDVAGVTVADFNPTSSMTVTFVFTVSDNNTNCTSITVGAGA